MTQNFLSLKNHFIPYMAECLAAKQILKITKPQKDRITCKSSRQISVACTYQGEGAQLQVQYKDADRNPKKINLLRKLGS
jgi:hypothetical protein